MPYGYRKGSETELFKLDMELSDYLGPMLIHPLWPLAEIIW
ncbi:DUF5018 domain-containing protein [Bacteroides sp. BFG-606]|nr:DUF5018 domain-containing protein [Bacteroides sp. BFG-606]